MTPVWKAILHTQAHPPTHIHTQCRCWFLCLLTSIIEERKGSLEGREGSAKSRSTLPIVPILSHETRPLGGSQVAAWCVSYTRTWKLQAGACSVPVVCCCSKVNMKVSCTGISAAVHVLDVLLVQLYTYQCSCQQSAGRTLQVTSETQQVWKKWYIWGSSWY